MSSTRETASLGQGLLALTAGAMAAVGPVRGRDRRQRSSGAVASGGCTSCSTRSSTSSAAAGSARAQAAIGSVLSVKPIITIEDGVVETVDRPRTRGKARARLLELFDGVKQPERVAILDCQAPEVESFADDLAKAAEVPARGDDVQPGRSIGRAARRARARTARWFCLDWTPEVVTFGRSDGR